MDASMVISMDICRDVFWVNSIYIPVEEGGAKNRLSSRVSQQQGLVQLRREQMTPNSRGYQ